MSTLRAKRGVVESAKIVENRKQREIAEAAKASKTRRSGILEKRRTGALLAAEEPAPEQGQMDQGDVALPPVMDQGDVALPAPPEDNIAIAATKRFFAQRARNAGPASVGPAEVGAPEAMEIPESVPDVGVKYRDIIIQTLLRTFAKSDFKHDFGEKVPSRDWITMNDRNRFSELIQKFPVKQRVTMLNMFEAEFNKPAKTPTAKLPYGKNLYELLQSGIAQNLYPGEAGDATEFQIEEQILEKVGLKYAELKDKIKKHFQPVENGPINPSPFVTEQEIQVDKIFRRNYRIGAQKYKNTDTTTRNLASLFKDATGGATNFAILVDASLGMSVSKIGDSSLTPDPGASCNFVVLQNVESDADSATGTTSFPITPGVVNTTKVDVMRDNTTSTVLYPIWQQPDPPSNTEILFSKVQILLNRVETGDVEASIIVDDESHNIPDIGTTSNVKNASLNALVALYTNKISDIPKGPGDERKPYIYALLKRMGDWCQALSLLDRTRTYTKQTGETETLQDLISKGYEVGLVTNDRILLAYGLVLGLNVYFTTATDLASLVYFKNMDDIVDQPALEEKASANIATFAQLLPDVTTNIQTAVARYSTPIDLDKLSDTIRENLKSKGVAPDGLMDGIVNAFRTKVILSNLGELRTNFAEIEAGIASAGAIYESQETPTRDKFVSSVTLINLANKFKMDDAHNTAVIDRMKKGMFSGTFTAQQNIFVDLAKKMATGGNLALSETMARAKDVLLSCRDDVKQIMQKGIMSADQLKSYIPSNPTVGDPRPTAVDVGNFEVLYGAFNQILVEIPANAQEGGGRQRGGDLTVIRSLFQKEVFPYKSAKLETTINNFPAEALEVLSYLPAARVGSFYRDDKSRPYSVIDRYLITKEDARILSQLFDEVMKSPDSNPEATNFAVYRLCLLYHDILYERFEHAVDQSYVADYVVEEGEPKELDIEDAEMTESSKSEFISVARETAVLRFCVNRYATGDKTVLNGILHSFQGGVDEVIGAFDQLELTVAERTFMVPLIEGVLLAKRRQTLASLRNLRDTIFKFYNPQMIDTVTIVTEEGKEIEGTAEGIENIIDNPAVGGGSSLQTGGKDIPNAQSTSGSSRRRLYQGLRKRSGSGSPSEL